MELMQTFREEGLDPHLPVVRRTAVRGIILRDGLLTLVRSRKFGEYRFPGGGCEAGESQEETLIREVREETGFSVLPASIEPFGETLEIRLGRFGDAKLEMRSFYYFCQVAEEQGPQDLDPYERDYGYRPVRISPQEAWRANVSLADRPGIQPWNRRETWVLEELCRRFKS